MQYNITYREKDKGIQFIISYKDSSSQWKQKSRQGFKTKREAKAAADIELGKLKKTLKSQMDLSPEHEGITFKDFATMFLDHEYLYKEENTLKAYKIALKSFVILNNLEVNKIKPIDIQKCVDDLIKQGLKDTTIRLYLTRIKTAFNFAKKFKIIIENPVSNISVPKSKSKNEKVALNKYELENLLSKIKNEKYRIISILAGKCGLRLGEIVGLTWNNIDEKRCVVKVVQQWKKLKTGKYGIGELKSKNSNREVPLPAKVLQELLKYKDENPTNIDNRIFNNIGNDTLANRLKNTYKNLGYDISIHELRHTYATMLISNGVDFKTAAQLLGHDIEQTMKCYSHVNDDMISAASKIINSIF